MFQPPRCPYRTCSQHSHPAGRFYARKGSYRPLCRSVPVPRFRCRGCGRGFSRQSFRCDYRDHRPDLNPRLFLLLASGLGLRQCSRILGLSLRCAELKTRKLARHLRRLNLNLRGALPPNSSLQFDELETYEGRRSSRPLSVPVLIERRSRFLVWAEAAPIRPHGRMSRARERAIAQDEARFGRRKDLSRRAVRRTLERARPMVTRLEKVHLESDEKSTYPALARAVFGRKRLVHSATNSKLARGTWNPLFPINHTEAMARDLMGRLRRESWLVSKKRRFLDLALQLWMAYRNYVRCRFNRDEESPAQLLGFARRRLRPGELLSWRQDWRGDSVHPISQGGVTVEQGLAMNVAA